MKLTEFHATNEIIGAVPSRTRLPGTSFMPTANPAAVTEPYRDLAQLGRQIQQAGAALAEFQRRKQEADQQSEALNLYTEFVKAADQLVADAKLGADPVKDRHTFTQTVDEGLRKTLHEFAGKASSAEAQRRFLQRAQAFYLERFIDARRHQDKLTVDFHTGALDRHVAEMGRQIAKAGDYEGARRLLDLTLKDIEAYRPIIGEDRVAQMTEKFKSSMGHLLARQAIFADPLAFLPTEAGGRGLHVLFEDLVKGEQMAELFKLARAEADRVRRARVEDAERAEKLFEKQLKEETERQVTEWLERLDQGESPDTIAAEVHARGPLGTGVITGTAYEKMRTALKAARESGGPGNFEARNRYMLMVENNQLVDIGKVLEHPTMNWQQKSQVVKAFIEKQKGLDFSDSSIYRAGLEFVDNSLGGAVSSLLTQALGMSGTYNVQADRLREQAKMDYRMAVSRRYRNLSGLLADADALKNIRKIAQDIVDQYVAAHPSIFGTSKPAAPAGATQPPPPAQQQQQRPQAPPAPQQPQQRPTGLLNFFTPPKQ